MEIDAFEMTFVALEAATLTHTTHQSPLNAFREKIELFTRVYLALSAWR